MAYRAIPLSCCCGEVPEQILEVGFTSDCNLVVHYWCSACNRVMFTSVSPEQCRLLCPSPEEDPEHALSQDAEFLRSLGISAT